MQKSTKSKIKITCYSTQKDLFVMIFLHRVELPSLILQRKKPIVLPGGAGCAGDGCNLHFLHPFWSLVPCLERKGLN